MQEQYNRFHGDYAIRKQLCPKAIDEYARLSQSQQLALRNEGEMPQEARMLRAWQNRSSNAAITMKGRIKKKKKEAQRSKYTAKQEPAGRALAEPASNLRNQKTTPYRNKKYGNELGH